MKCIFLTVVYQESFVPCFSKCELRYSVVQSESVNDFTSFLRMASWNIVIEGEAKSYHDIGALIQSFLA